MATQLPPLLEKPPLCACGCGQSVSWKAWIGWQIYRRGHNMIGKPGTRRGQTNSPEHQAKINAGRQVYLAELREIRETSGKSHYSTRRYQEARARLVTGRPCSRCPATEDIHAHHTIPGDDESLIPLCIRCHASHHHGRSTTKRASPDGSPAPLCACGCGRPVAWKRVRGWAKYVHGHANVKVGIKTGEAPLCRCGCGETTKYRWGRGWSQFKRGHDQRIHGAHHKRPK